MRAMRSGTRAVAGPCACRARRASRVSSGVLPAAVLLIACLVFRAEPATGTLPVPSPDRSTCDTCLVVDLCGADAYTVVVRDFFGSLLAGSHVQLDFRDISGIVLDPSSDPNGDGIFEAYTNRNGVARCYVRGGGLNVSGVASVEVTADGVVLCSAYPRSYDLTGDLILDQADRYAFELLPGTSRAGDFDCDGDKDAHDRGLLDIRVLEWQCTSTLAVGGFGSGLPGVSARCVPNPARSKVAFRLRSDVSAAGCLVIYDLTGRRIRSFDVPAVPPEGLTIAWDRRNGAGERVPSGAYFYRLRVGDRSTARRIVLLQ